MKTKQLDPKSLSQKEDWLGNNAAFACPVCGQVYIASNFPPRERRCPGCGCSRAQVTGSHSSGGKAFIIWDDTPKFTTGRKYSRRAISVALGGSGVDFLPTVKNLVVCGCFTLNHNPDAPNIVIPGTGKVIERTAKRFCDQDYPVPVFIKSRANEWEYVGRYKAAHFSTDPAIIAANHHGSVTPLKEITRVIFLKRSLVS
jgi:hypothetical protein